MTTSSKKIALSAAGIALGIGLAAASSAQAAPRPAVVPLPAGFSPEGVAAGAGNTVYVGSLRDGNIYRADLRTGAGELFIDAPVGSMAVGLKADVAHNRLFVAGGGTGVLAVYNLTSGALLAQVPLASPGATFLNDVAVTRDGVWVTDSVNPVLYFVATGDGTYDQVRTVPLSGPAADTSGAFNVNGIAATPDGKTLIVAHSALAAVIAVDPATGDSTTIDLGGASLPNVDGILLDGPRLWVVQNFSNQVSEVRLAPDYLSGAIVGVIASPDFRIPTTVARHGNDLAVVNARFDLGIPGPGDAAYEVVVVPR